MSPDNTINHPLPFEVYYPFSSDYYADDHFLVIEPKYVEYLRRNHLPESIDRTQKWLEHRPMLKAITSPAYFSNNALREVNEFIVSMSYTGIKFKPNTSIDTMIKRVGDTRRLEFGDAIIYLSLLTKAKNIDVEYSSPKAPNKEIGTLETARWDGSLSTEQFIALCFYQIDRNLDKQEIIALIQYTWEVIFRYSARYMHLPPAYPGKTSRKCMAYDMSQWNIRRIIDKTIRKNNKQLPVPFFIEETSPFNDAHQALQYLRKWRTTHPKGSRDSYLDIINSQIKKDGASHLKSICNRYLKV